MIDDIGEQLRQEREARGLTLDYVGKRLMMRPDHISNIERGKCQPRLITLQQIAHEVGLRVTLTAESEVGE